jgi:succinoglycan biosynthesis protein ExoA
VPVRNEERHIAACLDGIGAQTYPADRLDVIVVDGESDDRTVEIVRELTTIDPRIKIVSNPRRSMPSGLNLGIQHATGDYVGVVSGHSVLPPDYVERAVRASEATGAWSVGGRIVRRADTPMQRAIAIATASRVGVGDSAHNYSVEAGWVETVFPGLWRRELFDRIGLFDPGMIANEDNELSLRIRKAGGRIWFDPAIGVEYVPRSSLGDLFRQYRRYGLGKMRVLRKHRGGLRWRHFVPAALVAFLVIGAALAPLVPIAPALWIIGLAVYALAIALAGIRLARADTPWWFISAALVTLHVAYGIGTWQGLATWGATAPVA